MLYFQGCERGCKGCIAPDSHSIDGGSLYTIDEILNLISKEKDSIEGVTFSGGEPFLQSLQLAKIIKGIKKIEKDLSIMVYTGYTLEELKNLNCKTINFIIENTDILVDGPFDINLRLNDDPWRGSKNQNIYFLSDRYNWQDFEKAKRYGVELSLDEKGIFIYGIPPEGLVFRIENFLFSKGIF